MWIWSVEIGGLDVESEMGMQVWARVLISCETLRKLE